MIRPMLLVLALAGSALAETPPVTSVLVHPDAAIVTRASQVDCASGPSTVAFHGLPAALDPGSLRASVSGAGSRVEGLSIAERDLLQTASPELADLDQQLQALRTKAEVLTAQARRAKEEKTRATSLRNSAEAFIEREAAVQKKPDLAQWTTALDQTREVIVRADAELEKTRVARRDNAKAMADLQRRRSKLTGAAPAKTWDADVVVRCHGTSTVELSYLTSAARWTPAYEARADMAKKSVQLKLLAKVEQGTGEDWSDVDVTLSTALAQRDSRPPLPTRLYVSTYEQKEQKKVLVTRQEAASHAEGSTATATTGAAQVADQGLSVQLHVPEKSSVAGDGETARLVIETLPLAASFDLVTLPKALPAVFRRATLVNSARYPLLAGPIDLFDAHGFLGTTSLARTARGAKIKLAFGLDEDVQVHRVVLEEEKKDPGFFSGTRKLLYGYRFELASTAKEPLTLEVQDHVPVSELDDVKVVLEPQTTPGYQLARDDGLVTWQVPLQPGEKKNVELHFTVEIPSKYDSSGL